MTVHDTPARPMRRDAMERREALIAAARECFARDGYFVPLEEIADRAGVGRGTLYRNFKDRMALALAIFEHELDQVGHRVDATLPLDQALVRVVMQGAGAAALFARLATDMPLDADNRAAFEQLRHRLERLLQPLADRGHADGTLAPELGARELVLATRMAGGLKLFHLSEAERCEQVEAAVVLVMRGLSPR